MLILGIPKSLLRFKIGIKIRKIIVGQAAGVQHSRSLCSTSCSNLYIYFHSYRAKTKEGEEHVPELLLLRFDGILRAFELRASCLQLLLEWLREAREVRHATRPTPCGSRLSSEVTQLNTHIPTKKSRYTVRVEAHRSPCGAEFPILLYKK